MSFPTLNCKFPGMPPCNRINSQLNEFMENRIWPVYNPLYLAVFNRISMAIIHAPIEILLIGDKISSNSMVCSH